MQAMPPVRPGLQRLQDPVLAVVLDMEMAECSLFEWEAKEQACFLSNPTPTYTAAMRGTPFGTWLLSVPQLAADALTVSATSCLPACLHA
jgi:hypothetical protein